MLASVACTPTGDGDCPRAESRSEENTQMGRLSFLWLIHSNYVMPDIPGGHHLEEKSTFLSLVR